MGGKVFFGAALLAVFLSDSSGALGTAATTLPEAMPLADAGLEYLAMGDSVTYGDNGFVPYTPAARPSGDLFIGYPEELATELFHGNVANIACPGETTGSFLDVAARDNGCGAFKRDIPKSLHYQYTGAQIDVALAIIKANPNIRLVTMTLGANDLVLTQEDCAAASNGSAAALGLCIATRAPGVIAKSALNVGRIWGALRSAGYRGQMVFVTQYAANYSDLTQRLGVGALNTANVDATIARGGWIADAYRAFDKVAATAGGDSCKAGLLIPNPVEPPPAGELACDYHPDATGRMLIVESVRAVAQ